MTWTVWLDGYPSSSAYSPSAVIASAVWSLQEERKTPDRALAFARSLARRWPKAAVLVRCGKANRWVLLRGEAWNVRPDGALEACW